MPVYLRPANCPETKIPCVCRRRRPPSLRVKLPEGDPPEPVKSVFALVSIITPEPEAARRAARELGLKVSPYSLNDCVLYAVKSYHDVLNSVARLSRLVDVEMAYILTVTWVYKLRAPVPLMRLLRYGFIPHPSLTSVFGHVDASTVLMVYPSGLVRLTGPVSPDEARRLIGGVARVFSVEARDA